MGPRAAALLLLLPALAPAAHAQGGAELAAGYAYARSDGGSLHGWTASLAWGAGGALSLVGEATRHYGEQNLADLTRSSLLAGPRMAFGSGSPRPFVHLLAGAVRTSASIGVRGVRISEAVTDLGGAAGAGIDFRLGARWSLRLQGDYLLVKADPETLKDPRASLAAVYRLGGR